MVEDNDINREFAIELLRSEGIEVDAAINGNEALEKVQQRDCDAVLMDIQMPVMDGLEAARRIRGLAEMPGGERFARLPIIAMTALAMARNAEQRRAADMNDHVTKPIAPDQLMAALSRWIRLPAGTATAGNLGARELYRKLGEIDAPLKQGTVPCTEALAELQQLCGAVMHDIGRLPGEPLPASVASPAPFDPGRLLERLARLEDALERDLGAVDPLLGELRADTADTSYEAQVAAIAAGFDVFDIDEALALLITLRENLKQACEGGGP